MKSTAVTTIIHSVNWLFTKQEVDIAAAKYTCLLVESKIDLLDNWFDLLGYKIDLIDYSFEPIEYAFELSEYGYESLECGFEPLEWAIGQQFLVLE